MVLTKQRKSVAQPAATTQSQQHALGNHCRVPDLHGASIIDAKGREIPITESMIQRACQDFIQVWEQTHQRHAYS